MGLTVSRRTARRIMAVVNTFDHTPRPVGPRSSAGDGGGGGDFAVCEIQSGSSATGYTCKAYRKWSDYTSSIGGERRTLWITDIAADSSLPRGTVVVGHYVDGVAIGGDDYNANGSGG